MLQGPRPSVDELAWYNAESAWAEAWVGEGEAAFAVYIHMAYGEGFRATPPEDGLYKVVCFPRGVGEFAAYIEAKGFWTGDRVLKVSKLWYV